jgi:DNA-binding XRE family transcriptional regulator
MNCLDYHAVGKLRAWSDEQGISYRKGGGTPPCLRAKRSPGACACFTHSASGLTLEEAALAVRVAKQTLGDLEAGKPSVGLGIALRVAKALGVSLFIAPAGETGAIVQRIREARE